jgi:hypothetical protein
LISLVEKVRLLIIEGSVRVERFDASLVVDKDIEEHLADGSFEVTGSAAFESPAIDDMTGGGGNADSGANAQEVVNLKKKIYELSRENQQLKDENKEMSQRLEKIRQIA